MAKKVQASWIGRTIIAIANTALFLFLGVWAATHGVPDGSGIILSIVAGASGAVMLAFFGGSSFAESLASRLARRG